MKRILCIILCLVLSLAFAACKRNKKESGENNGLKQTQSEISSVSEELDDSTEDILLDDLDSTSQEVPPYKVDWQYDHSDSESHSYSVGYTEGDAVSIVSSVGEEESSLPTDIWGDSY